LSSKSAACGSTNSSWRAFFVQNNNAMILPGARPVATFSEAFDNYWSQQPTAFGDTYSANWAPLGLAGIDAQVTFSPHTAANALLDSIGNDIGTNTTSSTASRTGRSAGSISRNPTVTSRRSIHPS